MGTNSNKIYFGVGSLVFLITIICGTFISSQYASIAKNLRDTPSNNQLKKFSSCEKLKKVFENQKKYFYDGFERSPLSMPGVPTSASPTQITNKGGGDDYSKTNVQVEGVDEADIIKTDGEYIYTVTDNRIKIVKAFPAEEAKVVKTIELSKESIVDELFISNNRILAMGKKNVLEKSEIPNISEGVSEQMHPYNVTEQYSFIKIWDIQDKENPKLTRNVEFEGTYNTSRKIDNRVYMVINTYPKYRITNWNDPKKIIPQYSDSKSEKGDKKNACGCEDIEYFNENDEKTVGYGYDTSQFISILTIPINNDDQEINKRVIIGNSTIAYASLNNLYLTNTRYKQAKSIWLEKTDIYKFALKENGTDYLGSGSVAGHILNQFSMDEYNNYFRIATTEGSIASRDNNKSSNNLYILDDKLRTAGMLENLAPGEKIYSARFVGDKGYLVTFKKVDPFFTLDLKNPNNPKVLGQLKIPGYSDYLHPIDENHILGLGKNTIEANSDLKDARELNFAWYQGIKIAIFDVTDFNNPKEEYKTEIGDRGTDSYALSDHKAFLFDKDKNLLIIPVLLAELTAEQKKMDQSQAPQYGEYTFQGAYVYDLSLENGFKLKGRISHYPENKPSKDQYGYYNYYGDNLSVERSLYIKDKLYTVSEGKILINNLSDLVKIKEIILN